MITLRQMQYAVALAETGHFGRAAERNHVTQPGLSQQIRQLEELCGGPLFDRLGKSVRLTPLGREFVESISKRDYSVIMGTAIFYAVLVALANVVVDLSYGLVDPRIRVQR